MLDTIDQSEARRRPSLRSEAERNALVERNVGLVFGTLNRMGLTAHPHSDDLIQAGTLALIRAAELYDEARAAFSTFADYWIRREVLTELRRADLVRLPDNLSGEPRRRLRKRLRPVHVEAVAGHDGTTCHAAEVIADHREAGAVEDVDRAGAIERALRRLDARYAYVVRQRYLHGVKLDDVAAELGVARSRIQQIEARALRQLRDRCPSLADLLA